MYHQVNSLHWPHVLDQRRFKPTDDTTGSNSFKFSVGLTDRRTVKRSLNHIPVNLLSAKFLVRTLCLVKMAWKILHDYMKKGAKESLNAVLYSLFC